MVIIPFRNFGLEMKTSILRVDSYDGSQILFREGEFPNYLEIRDKIYTFVENAVKFRKHLRESEN